MSDQPRGETPPTKYRLEYHYRQALRDLAARLCPPRGLRASEANAIRCLIDDALRGLSEGVKKNPKKSTDSS